MKIKNWILSAAFLTWASSASAQTMTEITGRQWMLSEKDVREIFVLGYVNGLEQLLSHYNFQIRSGAGKTFDAHVLDEALYKKLVNEPELRSGPVRETLMIVLNDYAVLTDRVGNNLPSCSASKIGRISSPGRVETNFTPSVLRISTRASAARIWISFYLVEIFLKKPSSASLCKNLASTKSAGFFAFSESCLSAKKSSTNLMPSSDRFKF